MERGFWGGKGLPLGIARAFMMAASAISFPEMIILRRVLKIQLNNFKEALPKRRASLKLFNGKCNSFFIRYLRF